MSWAMDELEARAARQLDGLRSFQENLEAIAVTVTVPSMKDQLMMKPRKPPCVRCG